jgi:Rrf2 family iron-sulfur cluster assembly transcriptional regulator
VISKTEVHALTALAALARLPNGGYLGAAEIADIIGAPPNYLGKLLRVLGDEGLVESQKGKGGGFRLARSPASISLREVMEPVGRVSRMSGCFLGRPQCSDGDPCAVHDQWIKARTIYFEFLSAMTVADLAREVLPRQVSGLR